MIKIDSHQHFWQFDPIKDSWITDEMSTIQKDFYPNDLASVLEQNNIQGCIAVQADSSENENAFLLNLAADNIFIKGIVGWLDFADMDLSEKLKYYSSFPNMKGFRYVLQGNPKRDLMLEPQFLKNISLLEKYGFSYDILVFPDQLIYVKELISLFPQQKFVIDHLAKPYIKNKKINDWKRDLEAIAVYPNVYCKISGMVTEADWGNWKYVDFVPYLDVVVNTFGNERIMYGSDWPVCEVAGGYAKALSILDTYFESYLDAEKANIFGLNAMKFYNI